MAINRNSNCRLVLDSCCDLPRQVLDEAGIEFLEFPFMMNDGEHSDDLGVSMNPRSSTTACAEARSLAPRRSPCP